MTQTNQTAVLLESLYLPPINYMAQLLRYDTVWIEQHSHYQKASCRNRAYIGTSHGILGLSVPLAKGKNGHQAMRDVRISYNWDWQKLHWQSLHTAYRSSPYFEFYEADFYPHYQRRFDFLLDFNTALLDTMLNLLKHQARFVSTERYVADYNSLQPLLNDQRRQHTKSPNLCVMAMPPYRQVFADRVGFLPQLSVADLLFNLGNGAKTYLYEAAKIVDVAIGG